MYVSSSLPCLWKYPGPLPGGGQRRPAAFYRNILTIPARHKNHKVLLAFEGLRQTCYLYVNGTLAGYYEAGVAPFGFDITPYVRYDAPNLIAIATDNTATRNAPFCIAETPNKPDALPRQLRLTGSSVRYDDCHRRPS